MREKILSGWTWSRILFLVIGILVMIQGFSADQWSGTALGLYVAAMGLFGIGCAAGNCGSGNCISKHDRDQEK
ncbi:hypothetical protein [Salinimicrobium oceani]|uniref:Uncharacterized protein n=1 Tax=Salinimicrobium oceani TaxID=2722702 RepID=A0ABX1D229_9FLAO|nr:hypothetical protein [Salinimicrobium oceani]NJW52601.1 hypothetical protein [Salinimicrobium oceani]